METFTDRSIRSYTVKSNDNGVSTTEHTGFSLGPDIDAQLPAGTKFDMETQNFSFIVGIRVDGRWIMRKSDQDIERERAERSAKWEQDKRDSLALNRVVYAAQEAALPEWVKCRIEHFHQTGGERFLVDGWGYELTIARLAIARLAVAYLASGGEDDDEVNRISHEEGTSGNQHEVAKWLARMHATDPDETLAGTISGLTPLTGDPFFNKEST